MACRHCNIGRSLTSLVPEATISTRVNKLLDHGILSFPSGNHQRAVALLVSNIQIHFASHKLAYHVLKPGPRGQHQRCVTSWSTSRNIRASSKQNPCCRGVPPLQRLVERCQTVLI